ncbi:hypothetical protein NPIL_44041 [Nephila pilipes]|uniref:Uncharacterized protein n=1 Tax=Nephila pilipes TaxID=299642 RepID=A0A8X6MHC4_NEPPI|nr:hypothetical protein NPIL_44041 [Nephila pilipes]
MKTRQAMSSWRGAWRIFTFGRWQPGRDTHDSHLFNFVQSFSASLGPGRYGIRGYGILENDRDADIERVLRLLS